MSAKYLALLTHIGAARLANATALGSRLNITRMAVGDGGGTLPTPNPVQTTLINEQRRAALNSLSVDPKNPSQIIAEQVIPETEGGFWIREIGLFDDDGNLIAVANCPETYKPQLQEGSGRIQTVRMILIVSSTDAVTLKIDPAVVLATRGYVDDALAEHEKSRKHPEGTLTAKGFVQLSSATNSDSDVLAATPKAVKAANDNANGRVPSGRRVNGKALTADITLGAGDVGAYTKLETDTAVSVATTAANTAATAAANANTNANGRVPSGRTVNGKALSADIVLTAGDVGALTASGTAAAATKLATARKINGVAFDGSADISVDSDWSQIKNVPAASYDVAGVVLLSSSINSNSRTIAATAQQLFTAHSIATNALAKATAALPADGTAAAATKLATTRKINGVAFDGSTDINLPSDFPVGAPVPYPSATPPSGWIKCNGQSFNKALYPILASLYPSGVLPDLRGEFVRGWDDGRGADAGRALLSAQGDAIRNITGRLLYGYDADTGVAADADAGALHYDTTQGVRDSQYLTWATNTANLWYQAKLDASRVVPTANENRPRNIAFNYIVRAA
ncbi:phage tail-collar fiber domain-containing protein [Pectobacterium carotovorum]|uniref:phage tail-collar fiber domain-containing protein n=1 Tax=Pectobacterium carotovorum TaxID=554 RepID=UPI00381E05CC